MHLNRHHRKSFDLALGQRLQSILLPELGKMSAFYSHNLPFPAISRLAVASRHFYLVEYKYILIIVWIGHS